MKDLLIEALKASGAKLLEYFNNPLATRMKESQSSIVTEADIESEKLIINMIKNGFPGHNIISEEAGYIDNNSEYTWVIDPLDGTSNFASGIPWFGVLITLFNKNEPIMAGAYLPVKDMLYFAEAGNGVYRNGQPLPKLMEKDLKDSLVSFCVDYTEDIHFLNKGIEIYRYLIRESRNIRSTNSLLDFLYVAEGKCGAVVNLFTRIWDISGLGLIISETGGVMRNINGDNTKFCLRESIINENFPVIAGTEQIVESLMKVVVS